MRKAKKWVGDDDGDMEQENEYEYGDIEAAAEDEDGSDYGVHQFIAKDEARDPMGSDDNEADAAANDAARSKILSREEVFDAEDTPSTDNFLQVNTKKHMRKVKKWVGDDDGDMEQENEYEYGDIEAAAEDEDGSDYSVHQFIAKDEARDPMGSDDSEADAAKNDADRSRILSSEETFDSEDEPSPDNFLQKQALHSRAKWMPDKDTGSMEE